MLQKKGREIYHQMNPLNPVKMGGKLMTISIIGKISASTKQIFPILLVVDRAEVLTKDSTLNEAECHAYCAS
jgi:hypothetical protein